MKSLGLQYVVNSYVWRIVFSDRIGNVDSDQGIG